MYFRDFPGRLAESKILTNLQTGFEYSSILVRRVNRLSWFDLTRSVRADWLVCVSRRGQDGNNIRRLDPNPSLQTIQGGFRFLRNSQFRFAPRSRRGRPRVRQTPGASALFHVSASL